MGLKFILQSHLLSLQEIEVVSRIMNLAVLMPIIQQIERTLSSATWVVFSRCLYNDGLTQRDFRNGMIRGSGKGVGRLCWSDLSARAALRDCLLSR
jgi:hypothetical protein